MEKLFRKLVKILNDFKEHTRLDSKFTTSHKLGVPNPSLCDEFQLKSEDKCKESDPKTCLVENKLLESDSSFTFSTLISLSSEEEDL